MNHELDKTIYNIEQMMQECEEKLVRITQEMQRKKKADQESRLQEEKEETIPNPDDVVRRLKQLLDYFEKREQHG